ncbi:HP0268 family nuclease [Nautilia sp.]
MTLKLISTDNNIVEKSYEEFLKEIKPNSFFYFHKETSYKDLKDLIDKLEADGYSVYFREVKYGLDENSYMYELHII